MTEIFGIFVLILKNFKHVVAFLKIIERATDEAQINRALKLIDKGFTDAKTIKDAADAARNINDSYRH